DFHEGADLYDLYVNNCRAEDCWESGFYFEPNFYNGNDPNTAIPVQVNSRLNNCVAVNNGWRNTEPTRFYMTGFYLSCGVTLNNCVAINSRNNGFWVWQSAKDVILNNCTDDGSDKSFQVRTGTNLRFNNCVSKNARTYALYAWGSTDVVFSNFRIINPKKSSGAVSLGLREDHPNDPWPVRGCTFDILLTGADPDTLIRYYNAQNNVVTINGDPSGPEPTTTITPFTPGPTLPPTTTGSPTIGPSQTQGPLPAAVGNGVIPGLIEFEDYDDGGEGVAYHDITAENEGGAYRQDGVDIEFNEGAGSYVIDYNRPSEWLQYTVNVTTSGLYDVSFRVASPNSGTSCTLAVDGSQAATVSVPKTGSWGTYVEVKKQVTLTKGRHVLRVSTNGYHNLDSMKFDLAGTGSTPTVTATPTATVTPVQTVTPVPTSTSTPVPSLPLPQQPGANVPGVIEAENFNSGGEGVAYHDTTPENEGKVYRTTEAVDIEYATAEKSYVVAWVRPGEWIRYTVTVAQAGVYDVSFRVSSNRADGSFKMQVDDRDVCTVVVPNTGSYLTYNTVVQQVSLPAGVHTIRLYFNGYTNLNWMKFQMNSGTAPTATTPVPTTTVPVTTPSITPTGTSGTPTPVSTPVIPLPPPVPIVYGEARVPGVIEAEDYNNGGDGVAYYDTTPSNFGGVYRNDNVDIELAEQENSPVVCWIRPGEWLKYTVNVERTGYYDVTFRVSSPNTNSQMHLQVDGAAATTITVPNTGDFHKYTNVTRQVKLNAGPHVLRLVFSGYQNINYMSFAYTGASSATRGVDPSDGQQATPTPAVTPLPTVKATEVVTQTPIMTVTPKEVTPKATATVTPSPTTPAPSGPITPQPTVSPKVTAERTTVATPAPAVPTVALPGSVPANRTEEQ
ncbi:MAG TPA: carbohydrate-binding protein, partial [Methanoregulaceae archaeon]|nr:carbohydrate-binding protein [Methanoregulaceae archaeon]